MGDVEPAPLIVACRFIPYDQWLTTHINASWKVKQIKLWILAKCLGIPVDGAADRREAPAQRRRPASPITFAPDPRRRPVSPILFAKGTRPGSMSAPPVGEAKGAKGGPVESAKLQGVDDGTGYEEDDEYDPASAENDSLDDLEGSGDAPPQAAYVPDSEMSNFMSGVESAPEWARYNTNTASYTLLRFSTGQVLEDDYSLDWYELSPFELLELHAHAPVQHLPLSFVRKHFSADTVNLPDHHGKHRRSTSLYSLSNSAQDPHPRHAHNMDWAAPFQIRLPQINRVSLLSYVLPYWEGPVRALRVVWSEPDTLFSNFANGYGYGYGGATAPKYESGRADPAHPRTVVSKKAKLEWRMRWIVVREGTLLVYREREDRLPTSVVSLSSLTALRGTDHLVKSSYFAKQDTPSPRLSRSRGLASHFQSSQKPREHHKDKDKDKHRRRGKGKEPYHEEGTRPLSHGTHTTTTPIVSAGRSAKSPVAGSSPPQRTPQHSTPTTSSMPRTVPRIPSHDSSDSEEYYQDDDDPYRVRSPTLGRDFKFGVGAHADPRSPRKVGSGESLLHFVGDEAVDDLRIVCIRFQGPPKNKHDEAGGGDLGASAGSVPPDGATGGGGDDFRRGKQKVKGKAKVSSQSQKGEKAKEKRKRKARRILSWEKDETDKSTLKGVPKKMKRKTKDLDWIPGFGSKSKDKEREQDKKQKEKDEEKDEKDAVVLLGFSSSVGSSTKLVVDSKGPYGELRRRGGEQESSQEMLTYAKNPEAGFSSDGEDDSITFARGSDLESTSDDDGEMEEEGEDEGEYQVPPPADDDDDDDDDEANDARQSTMVGVKSGIAISLPSHRRAFDSMSLLSSSGSLVGSSHAHPQDELRDLGSDLSSDAGSSPVFAHSDVGMHSDDSDDEFNGGKDGYRYGYRYGYQYSNPQVSRQGSRALEAEAPPVEKKSEAGPKQGGDLSSSSANAANAEHERGRQEWIVFDMGTDIAFGSFLRILHRHLNPAVSSSFTESMINYMSPTPSPTPTPTPTPFPSPTSPRSPVMTTPHPFWMSPKLLPESDDLLNPKGLDTDIQPALLAPVSPLSPSSQSDTYSFKQPHHPLNPRQDVTTRKRVGVVPYPEWRLEVAGRAQRAGLGEIGRAMKWMLWQNRSQLELDLEEVQCRHDPDEVTLADIRRRRRETLCLKYRRRSTASGTPTVGESSSQGSCKARTITAFDSDGSGDTGRVIGMSDSGEETSEVEWQGWMADLHRQHQVQAERRLLEEEEMMKVCEELEEDEPLLYAPKNPEEDRKFVGERRRLLEPSASVIVINAPLNSVASSIKSTPSATLYSPSSSESLARNAAEHMLGLAPDDRPISPILRANHAPHSHHGHSQSQSSPRPSEQHMRRPSGSVLSHSTSLATGLRSSYVTADSFQRRPSMPSLTDQPVIPPDGSPGSSRSPFPPSTSTSPPFSPTFSSPFELGQISENQSRPPSQCSTSMSTSVNRRASTIGIGSISGGLGRSSSVLSRTGGLSKQGSSERIRERDEKGKGREVRADEKDVKDIRKLQLPKLSLAGPGSQNLVESSQPMSPRVKSPVGKARVRRVKSSSSMSATFPEGSLSASLATGAESTATSPKKKKGLVHGMERIVRKLDSAMDFLEEK